MNEFWWPSPEAINDLDVEDVEGGFDLSAPTDTECGDWLAYWSQSPDHVQIFNEEFVKVLQDYLKTLEVANG